MTKGLSQQQLIAHGLSASQAENILQKLVKWQRTLSSEQCWQRVSKEILSPELDFELHLSLYRHVYGAKPNQFNYPTWLPDNETINDSNLMRLLQQKNIADYPALYQWSYQNKSDFWQTMSEQLTIQWQQPYQKICDTSSGVEQAHWFNGGKLNIADSCFQHQDQNSPAIIYQQENSELQQLSVAQLNKASSQVANSLIKQGFEQGDSIAVIMPMTVEAIITYLGIIKCGMVVASIAESYSTEEIQTRLNIVNAKAIVTQDLILRKGKSLPLYTKIIAENTPKCIVISATDKSSVTLRSEDLHWDEFLVENDDFNSCPMTPEAHLNILFSSGTTGIPKAIPWYHTTAIKCASDGHLHQDIQPGEVVTWPTTLGWMMGPWLLFATLINKATIGLYYGAPTEREFGEFIQNAKVDILGTVPSIVKQWRNTNCFAGLDFSNLKLFSSTAEASNPEDMFWLMSRANYKPVIEYCGGTEVVAYISSSVMQANIPATFSTATMGLNFYLLDEDQHAASSGEIALLPPSLGFSIDLLNRSHDEVYYQGMPIINGHITRRHGDELEQLDNGYYRALGRADDTMKLGGIKISSIEIERLINQNPMILESAAIAVPPQNGGPNLLVTAVVLTEKQDVAKNKLKDILQQTISKQLNPLFKIHDIVFLDSLPRTASNKIMRRVLRSKYQQDKNTFADKL